MSLRPGDRLGSYEIVGPLGAGGMGEVFRARDSRLGRDAAIKILPELFLNDADRVARFEREARTLASLNHPNIAQIYGFEDSAGTRALVMELVDGEDLSAVIERGPLPLADALAIARQIAAALEAAHEQGIVHRDLKPANVKVRADGTVKVLDFGLARPGGSGEGTGSIANSPTMTSPAATAFGMIIGTAAYMSPEQARGKAVDRRADVWAFGVVLYEMLTGRRAYAGSEVSDVLASVLKDTLPIDSVPADTPLSIRRLLRRCLEKDRADRLDSMAAARLEISDALSGRTDGGSAVTATTSDRPRPRVLPLVAAVAVASALTGVVVWQARTPEPQPPTMLALAPPGNEAVRININQPNVAISHDGRHVAFSHGDAGGVFIVRSLDRFGDVAYSGLGQQPRSPFFSPDDQWLGYVSAASNGLGARLMKVPVMGGTPFEIAKVDGNLRGASWGRDDVIVFASTAPGSGLLSVPAAGGAPEVLTVADSSAGELDHQWPIVMPDGRHVVFTVTRTANEPGRVADNSFGVPVQRDLAVLDRSTRKWRVLRPGGSYPRLLTTGHLLYAASNGVFAVAFDPVACELRGAPVRVIEDLNTKTSGAADLDVSDAGTLTYVAGAPYSTRTLSWIAADGSETPIGAPPRAYQGLLLSPDSTHAVVGTTDRASDTGATVLQMLDLTRGMLSPLMPSDDLGESPVFSVDGRFIYYHRLVTGGNGVYRIATTGGGTPELVLADPADRTVFPTSVTPDGRLVVTVNGRPGRSEIQVLTLDGRGSLTPLVSDGEAAVEAKVSPDGRWLAYAVRTNSSGSREVFLRPFPNVNAYRVQVSTAGGSRPVWSRDSRVIFYNDNTDGSGILKVSVSPSGALGKSELVIPAAVAPVTVLDMATGDRFIRIRPVIDKDKTNELRLVLRWFDVLKLKMGAK